MKEHDEAAALARVVERLASAFPDTATTEIASVVDESRRRFDQSPVRDYVPVLVERAARARLREPSLPA